MSLVPVDQGEVLHLGISLHEASKGGRVFTTTRDGAVRIDLIPLGLDRKRRVARYELRIANETPVPLAAYGYAVRRDPKHPPITCVALAIRARSAAQIGFEVALLERERFERIAIEVRGDDIHMGLDALPPPAIPELPRRSIALAGVTLLIAAFLAFYFARPRIVGLSLPSAALVGSRVDAVYAVRGNGRLGYDLLAGDGTPIASGPLDAQDGTIPIALAVHGPSTYLLRLTMAGPLGRDVRIATLEAQDRPVARTVTRIEHPPRIASLAVEHDRVAGGSPIVVYYDIDATTGDVRLIDRNGVVWGQSALGRGSGIAHLQAPVFQEARELSVDVRAFNGPARTESSVGVLVLTQNGASPSPSASGASPSGSPSASPVGVATGFPSPTAPIASGFPANVAFPAAADVPFRVPKRAIHGGKPLTLPILRHETALRIALVAPDGHEIASATPGDHDAVTLAIPNVNRREPQRFTIVASYQRGTSLETVVREVRVFP